MQHQYTTACPAYALLEPGEAQLELQIDQQRAPVYALLEPGGMPLGQQINPQLAQTCALWAARLLGALPSAPNALWGLHMLILADRGVVQIVLSAHQEPI